MLGPGAGCTALKPGRSLLALRPCIPTSDEGFCLSFCSSAQEIRHSSGLAALETSGSWMGKESIYLKRKRNALFREVH